MTELRGYQTEALEAIRQSVKQKVFRLVLQAPTGSGKTRVAADIVQGAQAKGNRITFVVPAISLIDQAVEMFWKEGIRDIGVIQANHPLTDWSKTVQVASIQTVRSRKVYPESAVVIIDEVHNLHKEHIAWLTHPDWQTVPMIGLSATPWTRGLGRYFQSLQIMCTTRELIDAGYLSKFKTYAADHPDLSDVKTVAGDYHEGQLSGVMGDAKLVANIVQTWKQRWGKGNTLLFAVDRNHASVLRDRFEEAGIRCGYQDANTPPSERAEIKRAFHNGDLQIVANIGTLTTGIDWDVRCLVLARPTKSEMLFVQIIGRALRTADGKDHALILDHTDTTARLGLVTDIHHDHLDDGRFTTGKQQAKRIKTPPLPKPCPQCAFLIPPAAKSCEECGYVIPKKSPIYEREGELDEITEERLRKKVDDMVGYGPAERAHFYAQLKTYGMQRGYKEGWAAYKYQEKFKAMPPWSWRFHPPAQEVGADVRNFITSRNIAWRYRQQGR